MKNRRETKFVPEPLQKKLILFIFLAAVLPVIIVTVCLYYLIFNLLSQQMGIPEAIAYHVIPVAKKVSFIIFTAVPITLLIIWVMALELSHRIAGPLYRIEKELDERIRARKNWPIKVRDKDELKHLVDRLNSILDIQKEAE
jgi:hypothetical protein